LNKCRYSRRAESSITSASPIKARRYQQTPASSSINERNKRDAQKCAGEN